MNYLQDNYSKMKVSRFRDIVILMTLAVTITVGVKREKVHKLNPKGGNILIISNSTSKFRRFRFPHIEWNYDFMAKVQIFVGNVSKDDSIVLRGFGPVTNTSCFFLVQNIESDQKLFSKSCTLDEIKVKRKGCEVVKNVDMLRLTARTAPSSMKKNLFYVEYSLHQCNADTNISTNPPSFFAVSRRIAPLIDLTTIATTNSSSSREKTFAMTRSYRESSYGTMPSQDATIDGSETSTTTRSSRESSYGTMPSQDATTDGSETSTTTRSSRESSYGTMPSQNTRTDGNTVNDELHGRKILLNFGDSQNTTASASIALKNYNTALIAGSVSGTVLFLIIVTIIIRCRLTRSRKKQSGTLSSQAETLNTSIGSAISAGYAGKQRFSEPPDKPIFSPSREHRPRDLRITESYNRNGSSPIHRNHSFEGISENPIQASNWPTYSPCRDRKANDEEEGFAYDVSPVNTKAYATGAFSESLSELLNSRPTADGTTKSKLESGTGNNQDASNHHEGVDFINPRQEIEPTSDFHTVIAQTRHHKNQYQSFVPLSPPSGNPTTLDEKRNGRHQKNHDYINVLPHIAESRENVQSTTSHEGETDGPTPSAKPPGNGYVPMANIHGPGHTIPGLVTEVSD